MTEDEMITFLDDLQAQADEMVDAAEFYVKEVQQLRESLQQKED